MWVTGLRGPDLFSGPCTGRFFPSLYEPTSEVSGRTSFWGSLSSKFPTLGHSPGLIEYPEGVETLPTRKRDFTLVLSVDSLLHFTDPRGGRSSPMDRPRKSQVGEG